MSVTLDALKALERQRGRPLTGAGAEVAAEMPRPRSSSWLMGATVIVGAMIAGVVYTQQNPGLHGASAAAAPHAVERLPIGTPKDMTATNPSLVHPSLRLSMNTSAAVTALPTGVSPSEEKAKPAVPAAMTADDAPAAMEVVVRGDSEALKMMEAVSGMAEMAGLSIERGRDAQGQVWMRMAAAPAEKSARTPSPRKSAQRSVPASVMETTVSAKPILRTGIPAESGAQEAAPTKKRLEPAPRAPDAAPSAVVKVASAQLIAAASLPPQKRPSSRSEAVFQNSAGRSDTGAALGVSVSSSAVIANGDQSPAERKRAIQQARDALVSGRPGAASALLQEAMIRWPQAPEFRQMLAHSLLVDKRPDQAVAVLAPLTPDIQTWPHYYTLLGQAYLRLGYHERATGIYRLLVDRFPTRAEHWVALGLCYEARGDRRLARQVYEQALLLAKEDAAMAARVRRSLVDLSQGPRS